MPSGPSAAPVLLPDQASLRDLRRYLSLAARVDPGGAARLVSRADMLAGYVAPLHGSGGPTVLGLRVLRLAAPAELDLTAPLTALLERLADAGPAPDALPAWGEPSDALPADRRARDVGRAEGGPQAPIGLDLRLQSAATPSAGWAGVSPPRQGWEPVGLVEAGQLRAVVAAGVDEIVAGTPPTAGAAQVSALRARVWGRALLPSLPDTPCGIAFAADALGFLDDAEPAALYRRGAWSRLTTSRGHVLARPPMLGGPAPRTARAG